MVRAARFAVILGSLLCSLALFAGTIASVTPPQILAGSGEQFLTVSGQNLNGTYFSIALYDGPAGHFEVKAGEQNDANHATFWIPLDIMNRPGRYSIIVRAHDENGGTVVYTDSNTA